MEASWRKLSLAKPLRPLLFQKTPLIEKICFADAEDSDCEIDHLALGQLCEDLTEELMDKNSMDPELASVLHNKKREIEYSCFVEIRVILIWILWLKSVHILVEKSRVYNSHK